MSIQHNESIKERKKMPKKKIGYVSVAQGDGIIDEFKKFGCDIVINGGQTMNSSTDEFIDAFNRINAENIIVLPNDKNLILTALQAKNLTINKNIYIVETKSLQEGYFALSMMDLEESDVKKQINNINLGIKNVVNIKTTKAIRDFSSESFTCLRGDYITFINNKMVSASTSLVESLISAIKNNLSLGDYEICMVIKGQQVKEEIVNQIVDEINLLVDYIDLGVVDGKQDVYDILVGLS
jgi:hypothetical protein